MVQEKMKQAVKVKDFRKIRNYLIAEIALDAHMKKSFLENLEYCKKNGILESKIFQEHKGKLPKDKTEENFSFLIGELTENFSRERLNVIKEIAKVIFPEKVQETAKSKQTSTIIKTEKKRTYKNKKEIAPAVKIVVAVVGIVLIAFLIKAIK